MACSSAFGSSAFGSGGGGDGGGGSQAEGEVAVWAAEGATFAQAVATAEADARAKQAQVLSIDAADLGKLCRCLAGLPQVHALAHDLPRLLSNSYHYCDTTDNPYFVSCKKASRSGCRKHKTYLMNVSRGVQTPPAIPIDRCGGSEEKRCMAYALPAQHITEGVVGRTSV
mmetsp:Transcript_25251/g.50787  ORF Transcript_25251/g.50787 Transcript_25251/m.50787 type:complete len:170 (-) Transcript_25251:158-667(-)